MIKYPFQSTLVHILPWCLEVGFPKIVSLQLTHCDSQWCFEETWFYNMYRDIERQQLTPGNYERNHISDTNQNSKLINQENE